MEHQPFRDFTRASFIRIDTVLLTRAKLACTHSHASDTAASTVGFQSLAIIFKWSYGLALSLPSLFCSRFPLIHPSSLDMRFPSTATSTSFLLLAAIGWLTLTSSGRATLTYIWEGDRDKARKRVALRQLKFLRAELTSLADRIERARERTNKALRKEEEGRDEEEEEGGRREGEKEEGESAASTSAYYHFSSSGRKFKNKWDEYDVERELERLEQEEKREGNGEEKLGGGEGREGSEEEEGGEANGQMGREGRSVEGRREGRKEGGREGEREGGKEKKRPTLGQVRTEVGELQSDLEKAMGHLDSVRGDEEVRRRRKALVLRSHELFTALDEVTQRLL